MDAGILHPPSRFSRTFQLGALSVLQALSHQLLTCDVKLTLFVRQFGSLRRQSHFAMLRERFGMRDRDC